MKWCLRNSFNFEQARDYHVEEDKVSWWMLATADHLRTPAKFRAELVVKEGKIESFTLYLLDTETMEELEAVGPQGTSMRALITQTDVPRPACGRDNFVGSAVKMQSSISPYLLPSHTKGESCAVKVAPRALIEMLASRRHRL